MPVLFVNHNAQRWNVRKMCVDLTAKKEANTSYNFGVVSEIGFQWRWLNADIDRHKKYQIYSAACTSDKIIQFSFLCWLSTLEYAFSECVKLEYANGNEPCPNNWVSVDYTWALCRLNGMSITLAIHPHIVQWIRKEMTSFVIVIIDIFNIITLVTCTHRQAYTKGPYLVCF